MMLSPVIVPLDGSPLAERALPYAEALARREGSRLVLLRAVDGDPNAEPDERQAAAEAESAAYLGSVAGALAARGLTANTATLRGDVAEQIVAESEERGAGLIVMATHSREGLARLFSGSVAEEVLQRTSRPVMFIRADADTLAGAPFSDRPRVVVPLDGTPFGELALPLGHDLARLLGGELVLLSIITPPPPPAMGELSFAAMPYAAFDLEGARRESEAYLRRAGEQYGIDPARVQASVEIGGTAEGIVGALAELGASLVVMATHARSGLGRLIFGSTTSDTLQRIAVPLVLLRAGDDELAGSEQAERAEAPAPLAAAVNIA